MLARIRFLRQLSFCVMTLVSPALIQIASGQEITEKFLASGVTERVGGYRPIRAEMDLDEEIVKVAPDDAEAPKYGKLELGEWSWGFILNEPEEGTPRLFIDTNNDGDFTNDPETEWEGKQRGEFTQFSGKGQVDLGDGKLASINLYRFDPKDEAREALKNTMMFYPDFGTEFAFTLDGEKFETFAAGIVTEETAFPVDRNGDGKSSRNYEMITQGEPFNFTGTTYLLTLDAGKLKIAKSEEELPVMPMPPDLQIGKPALEFTAKTMDGDEVSFPLQYKGKVVMLDFWATWCGPCIGEIPNMKQAYEEWHDKGFEILGVSFDREGMEEKLTEFLEENELPWPQIYEGKGWDTTLGKMHDVSGIPFVLLVDGDTGQILATARELRGEGLSEFIGEQLAIKNGDEKEEEKDGEEAKDGEEEKDGQ